MAPAMRRLWYESQVILTADMTRLCAPSDTNRITKLNPQARVESLQALRDDLAGITVEGNTEPSHHLTDQYVAMFDEQILRHLPWESYTSRTQETRGDKADTAIKHIVADEHGILRGTFASPSLSADLRGDLRMKEALDRRGSAMQMADLLSYKVHAKLVQAYTSQLLCDDVPPGYTSVTWRQLQMVDAELW
eukprot:3761579-Amphidinium_carterae.1